MFFVQYNTQMFPQEEEYTITTRCKTRRKAIEFLRDEFKKNGYVFFYAPVVFNEDTQKFIRLGSRTMKFIYGTEK